MSKDKTIFKPFENIYDENFIKLQKERNKMIKYAKTKDNRIVKVDVEGGVFTSRYEIVGFPTDTIEELCDEFVLIRDNGKPHLLRDYDNLSVLKGRTIYGAIWTKKGLIYIAKMNKEGELELL